MTTQPRVPKLDLMNGVSAPEDLVDPRSTATIHPRAP